MPIKNKTKKSTAPPPAAANPTGQYSQTFQPPQAYQPIQTPSPTLLSALAPAGLPAISSRDLKYFFEVAASLYKDGLSNEPINIAYRASEAPPAYADNANDVFRLDQIDERAVLVLWLFRQTATHIRPVAERFHLGPADRQPLYALTAQPSPRSAQEFNELIIKRRDPIKGVWYAACTSDIEPSLELVKPGNWKVASLTMDAMPVWKRVVSGQVFQEEVEGGRGTKLRLWWGDRKTRGAIGDAYGLWWETGDEAGNAEAFYLVDQWSGFENSGRGIIRVKAAYKQPDGQFVDPRTVQQDLATLYFHNDGWTPPQFVCGDVNTQIRLDLIMAGLMTVLVVETRKAEVVKELGNLPEYDSLAQWTSRLVEEGNGWDAQ